MCVSDHANAVHDLKSMQPQIIIAHASFHSQTSLNQVAFSLGSVRCMGQRSNAHSYVGVKVGSSIGRSYRHAESKLTFGECKGGLGVCGYVYVLFLSSRSMLSILFWAWWWVPSAKTIASDKDFHMIRDIFWSCTTIIECGHAVEKQDACSD